MLTYIYNYDTFTILRSFSGMAPFLVWYPNFLLLFSGITSCANYWHLNLFLRSPTLYQEIKQVHSILVRVYVCNLGLDIFGVGRGTKKSSLETTMMRTSNLPDTNKQRSQGSALLKIFIFYLLPGLDKINIAKCQCLCLNMGVDSTSWCSLWSGQPPSGPTCFPRVAEHLPATRWITGHHSKVFLDVSVKPDFILNPKAQQRM